MTGDHLNVREAGSGRPVLLLHGWSCHGGFFDRQVAELAKQAHCLVPDLPGHGATGAALPLAIEAAADALACVLEDRNLQHVVLVGWSMGAHVAYSLLQRHGTDRCATMVSIDMSPKVLNAPSWTNGMLNGLNDATNQMALEGMVAGWAQRAERVAEQLFAKDSRPPQELLAYARQEIRAADPQMLKSMWASLTKQDFREFLAGFPIPLHLVSGAASQLYGLGVGKWYEQNVPDFTLHSFGRSGHSPHMEEPERFNELLVRLIAS